MSEEERGTATIDSPAEPTVQTPPPNHYIPGEPKKGLAEKWRIIKERRALRKDLKAKGITRRDDFEAIAESLGLVLWKDSAFFLWLHHFLGGLRSGLGLKSLLAAAAALLTAIFLLSTITESKGAFTVNLTADMLRAGFVLSENRDFLNEKSRLFSQRQEEVNNITMTDISENVDQIDGAHNGDNYVAYTFYIRNRGSETADYAWYLRMTSEIMSVSDAVWIMLFEDGRQMIYTRATPEGEPEELYGFSELPFMDAAYDYDKQYYQKDGLYGVVTTPYANDTTVAQGVVRGVEPGEAHKYTVVIWVEGYDPECTDEIFGGYAKFDMEFENVSHQDVASIFNGIYRTEYEDYGKNPEKPAT